MYLRVATIQGNTVTPRIISAGFHLIVQQQITNWGSKASCNGPPHATSLPPSSPSPPPVIFWCYLPGSSRWSYGWRSHRLSRHDDQQTLWLWLPDHHQCSSGVCVKGGLMKSQLIPRDFQHVHSVHVQVLALFLSLRQSFTYPLLHPCTQTHTCTHVHNVCIHIYACRRSS